MRRRLVTSRRALGAALLLLSLSALLPAELTAWAGWVRDPVMAALAPAAQPLRWLSGWIRPAERGAPEPEAVRALEDDRDRFRMLWRRSERRVGELERLVEDLQRGRALYAELRVSDVLAPVVGASADASGGTLLVRAGRDRGVTVNTVAAARGVHLVGLVVDVGARTSDVLPVTHRRTGWIRCVVDTGGEAAALPGCQLEPTGSGLLRGELDAGAEGVEEGMEVRLLDEGWPQAAQMLVVGRVRAVERKESQPLRRVLVVEPALDVRRVDVVSLRVAEADGGADGGAGG